MLGTVNRKAKYGMNTKHRSQPSGGKGAILLPLWVAALIGSAQAQDNVYFGNLHSHTSYSDGSGSPLEAYAYARDVAGLDFLALTEHNHGQAVGDDGMGIGLNHSLYNGNGPTSLISIASQMTQPGQFVALYGQEYSTISSGNHVNVFDIRPVITAPNGQFNKLVDFLGQNKDSFNKSAIVMLNHPKNTFNNQPKEYGKDDFSNQAQWVELMGSHARLIQLINGPGQTGGTGHSPANPDEAAYLKYLNLGFKLAPTADQDNHEKNWGNATTARTGVIAPQLSKMHLLDALRQRHVYATQDPNLKVIIRVNGRLCGDVISSIPPAGQKLTIGYRISDADEPSARYALQVYADAIGGSPAKLITSIPLPSNGSGGAGITGTIGSITSLGTSQYYFFKVVQLAEDTGEDDAPEDLAWTAPIWFEAS